jgi:NAD(P)-dependent dehydrogenase (short-subunit alcohol dehydrogenase family)
LDIKGKAAVVTGSSSDEGIGAACARLLAARGCNVVVNYASDKTGGEAIAAECRTKGVEAIAVQADVSKDEDCKRLVAAAIERWGRLDVLVNNAAINWEMPIAAHTEEIWEKHVDTILKGSFFCAKAAIPALKANRGNIVNIASELGLHPIVNNVAYCAAKGGVVNLTRALAVELAPEIRVNCIAPGAMDTELMRDCAQASGDAAAYYRYYQNFNPLKRIAKPEEVAESVVFVASAAAAFMTGAIIPVDGGSIAGRL